MTKPTTTLRKDKNHENERAFMQYSWLIAFSSNCVNLKLTVCFLEGCLADVAIYTVRQLDVLHIDRLCFTLWCVISSNWCAISQLHKTEQPGYFPLNINRLLFYMIVVEMNARYCSFIFDFHYWLSLITNYRNSSWLVLAINHEWIQWLY